MNPSVVDFKDLNRVDKMVLVKSFYDIVRCIPAGKVATYGQVAKIAGRPKDAREVGNALSGMAKTDVPWHRVVLASGRIAMPTRPDLQKRQRALLCDEGVKFIGEYQVNINLCGWQINEAEGAGQQGDLFA